jgi:hypothetical protein
MMSLPRRPSRRLLGVAAATLLASVPAQAQVSWTDWTSAPDPSTVVGTLTFGGGPVTVTYSGSRDFVQLGCPTDYWVPTTTYTGPGVPNPPVNCEMIAFGVGGLKTFTFSAPVVNPLLALVSWNVGNVAVSGPVELVNSGPGVFGSGTLTPTSTGFLATNEFHGVIRLLGTYTSFTITDPEEHWHGITVGATSLAPSQVPEPATVALVAGGLLALGAVARRRRA